MEVKRLGNIYGFDGGNYAGNIYDINGLAPAIWTIVNKKDTIYDKNFTGISIYA